MKESASKTPAKLAETHAMRPFDLLQSQIDRVFSDFGRGFHMPELFGATPLLEVHHTDKAVTVTAELPGVTDKEIDISVTGPVLTISGEKKSENERKDGEYFRSERSYGSFSRSVTLPFDIDADKVGTTFKDGVLTLTIEKPADVQEKTRKVEIRH